MLRQLIKIYEKVERASYMSDSINQWQSSAGEAISRRGNRASATARLRGNNKYLEAASNISSTCTTITSLRLKEINAEKIINIMCRF